MRLSWSVCLSFNGGAVGFGFGFRICGFAVLGLWGVVLLVFVCVGMIVDLAVVLCFRLLGCWLGWLVCRWLFR